MNAKTALLLLLLLLLGGLAFVYFKGSPLQQSSDMTPTGSEQVVEEKVDQVVEEGLGITVTAPTENQKVLSPLMVTGEAAGWYFEGSFPVKIVDSEGAVLGTGFVTAQGDWMSAALVPFEGEVSFSAPTTSSGYLVLMADNPSGLAENDKEFKVKINF